jgi:DNA-3-methyladenine glycosylase I
MGHITIRSTDFRPRQSMSCSKELVLEINQAGLSWLTILKKREGLIAAYDGFEVDKVAAYGETEKARLLSDVSIIRNRLKVDAAIENAKRIQRLRESHGSFKEWLDAHHPLVKPDWVKLFKKTFKFTGGEITGEFMMSLGYLPGAHHDKCPVQSAIRRISPPWTQVPARFWRAE